jgi:hypothetical protein
VVTIVVGTFDIFFPNLVGLGRPATRVTWIFLYFGYSGRRKLFKFVDCWHRGAKGLDTNPDGTNNRNVMSIDSDIPEGQR